MADDKITFNCGEFRPGKKPVVGGTSGGGRRGPSGGPTLITITKKHGSQPPIQNDGNGPPTVPIANPGSGDPKWYKCEKEIIHDCSRDPNTYEVKPRIVATCEKCTQQDLIDDQKLKKADRKCVYKTLLHCESFCQDQDSECGRYTGSFAKTVGRNKLYHCNDFTNEPVYCGGGQQTLEPGFRRGCVECEMPPAPGQDCKPLSICQGSCTNSKPSCLSSVSGGPSQIDKLYHCKEFTNEPVYCGGGQQTIKPGVKRGCVECGMPPRAECKKLSICEGTCISSKPSCLSFGHEGLSQIRGGKKKTYSCKEFTNEPVLCGAGQQTIKPGAKRGCVECDQDGPGCNPLELCKDRCISSKPLCLSTGHGVPSQIRGGKKKTYICKDFTNEPIFCGGDETTLEAGVKRGCVECAQDGPGCNDLSVCKHNCISSKPSCLSTGGEGPEDIDGDPSIPPTNIFEDERSVDLFREDSNFGGVGLDFSEGVSNIFQIAEDAKMAGDLGSSPFTKVEEISLYDEMQKSLEGNPHSQRNNSIYDHRFNLTLTEDEHNDSYELERNDLYLNIFSTAVSRNVKWFLDNISASAWNEYAFANLSLSHIAQSLSPILLNAFNSIKFVGGIPIELETMLEMVKSLLLSDRLDEFNDEYYINLAKEHNTHYKVKYSSEDTNINIRTQAALGLITHDSTESDPETYPDGFRPYLRKFRYLNEDIDAGMPVLGCDGATSGAALYNEGLQVVRLKNSEDAETITANEQVSSIIELAEGGGYYLSASICDNFDISSAVAVDASSNLSSTLNVGIGTRENSLNILDEDSSLQFTVSSTYSNSEFGDNYNLTSDLSIMSFMLDLSTVGTVSHNNKIINDTSAAYTMVTSVDTINNFARSHGFNVKILNVDYNDPFLIYASGASSMDLRLNDVTFDNFLTTKGNIGNIKIPRRLPFLVILNPGKGSKHNPLFGKSDLVSWEDTITRKIHFIPGIDYPENGTWDSVLEPYFTAVEDDSYRTGLMEPIDVNSLGFRYETSSSKFQNTYYSNGTESSTMPTRTREGLSILVRKVDNLVSKYNIPNGKITWYDVWKRFTSAEFHSIQNVPVSTEFVNWISGGGRGVKITKIISKWPLEITGLGSVQEESIEDDVYILDDDRGYDSAIDPPIQE